MIDVLKPSVFSGYHQVDAWFTKANRNESGGIQFGLTSGVTEQAVQNNYHMLLHQSELGRNNLALARQIHGVNIQRVTESGIYPDTDGFVTATKGIYLGIQVADCAAVLIADPINHVIGAFHAGWRGAINGIITAGLELMEKEGGYVKNFYVFISPCISQRAFEVGDEVADLFPDQFCDRKSYKKPHVDLAGYLHNELTGFGVIHNHIEHANECTYNSKDYFSYRREREKAGRMLAVIGMKLNNTK